MYEVLAGYVPLLEYARFPHFGFGCHRPARTGLSRALLHRAVTKLSYQCRIVHTHQHRRNNVVGTRASNQSRCWGLDRP